MNYVLSQRTFPGAVPSIPGTTIEKCVQCKHDLFASPSSIKLMAEKSKEHGEFGFICEVCMKENVSKMTEEERKQFQFMGSCKDQIDEVNSVVKGPPTQDLEFLNFLSACAMGADGAFCNEDAEKKS
jgi:hypothetical protein